MDDESLELSRLYERAEKIVAEKVGFLRHLLVYVLANGVLVAVNLGTSSGFLWFVFPLGAWSIVLLGHFVIVFVLGGEWFERWRGRQIEREVERLRRRG